MDRSLMTASVSMGQIQKKINNIANNLANINTYGYKSRDASFSSLLFQQMNNQPVESQEVGRLTPNGIRVGSGARIGDTQLNLKQGAIQQTGRSLDLALTMPDHFFQIEGVGENGQIEARYTRDGVFYLQPNASNPDQLDLVTKDGQFVTGANGRIHVPAQFSEITIDGKGTITATMNDNSQVNVGQLQLVAIKRPQLMEAVGGNQFAFPNLQALGMTVNDVLNPINNGDAAVQQGALEASNVDMAQEMVDLVQMQRTYQVNARSISIADQMMGLVNSIR